MYHYISPTTSSPLLGLNLLDFSSGWPVVVLPAINSPTAEVPLPTTTLAPAGVPTPVPVETVTSLATTEATYFTTGSGPHGAANASGKP